MFWWLSPSHISKPAWNLGYYRHCQVCILTWPLSRNWHKRRVEYENLFQTWWIWLSNQQLPIFEWEYFGSSGVGSVCFTIVRIPLTLHTSFVSFGYWYVGVGSERCAIQKVGIGTVPLGTGLRSLHRLFVSKLYKTNLPSWTPKPFSSLLIPFSIPTSTLNTDFYSFKHRLCLFAFIDRALLLTQKLLNQGYIASKLQSSLLTFLWTSSWFGWQVWQNRFPKWRQTCSFDFLSSYQIWHEQHGGWRTLPEHLSLRLFFLSMLIISFKCCICGFLWYVFFSGDCRYSSISESPFQHFCIRHLKPCPGHWMERVFSIFCSCIQANVVNPLPFPVVEVVYRQLETYKSFWFLLSSWFTMLIR